MSKVLSSLRYAATVLLALGLVVGQQAHAEDAKTFAGSECVASSGSISYSSSQALGGAYNSSSSTTATWICPIVREGTSDEVEPGEAEISVYDPSATVAFSCKLATRYPGSSGSSSGGYGTGSNGAASTTGYSTFTLPGTVVEMIDNGWYYLECTVPPGAKLYSYVVMESTDG